MSFKVRHMRLWTSVFLRYYCRINTSYLVQVQTPVFAGLFLVCETTVAHGYDLLFRFSVFERTV